MPELGYKLMSEEHDPADLVRNAARAEQAGFIGSHRAELSASSVFPEMEAPAPIPSPLAPAGTSCFGPQLAATGSDASEAQVLGIASGRNLTSA